MKLTRISRKYGRVDVTATLADGTPTDVAGVDVALLPAGISPTSATEWVLATYDDGVATVLFAGPDADSDGALVVPAEGAYLWMRVVDAPEVDVARIEKISVTA